MLSLLGGGSVGSFALGVDNSVAAKSLSYNTITTDQSCRLYLKGDDETDSSPNALSPAWTGSESYQTTEKKWDYVQSIQVSSGVSNYLTVDDDSLDFEGTQNFTLCAFVYPHTSVVTTYIIGGASGGDGYNLAIDGSGSADKLQAYTDGASAFKSSTSTISTGAWKHLGAAYNGSALQLTLTGQQTVRHKLRTIWIFTPEQRQLVPRLLVAASVTLI